MSWGIFKDVGRQLGVLQEIELGTEVRKLGNHLCSGKLPFRFLAPSV